MTSSSPALRRSDTSSVDLPDEIIESILSTLSKNQNKFFVWAAPGYGKRYRMHLIVLEDGKFQTHPVLGYPSREFFPLCSCNGLILLRRGGHQELMLWNPLLRKHFIIPAFKPHTYIWKIHLYHDSLTNDYKIVVCYQKCYTVYSCNNGSWEGIKDFPKDWELDKIKYSAVFVDGCLYELKNDEIRSFDARDGKQQKFRQPKEAEYLFRVRLEEVSGRLCLRGYSVFYFQESLHLFVMGNKNGSSDDKCWRKLIISLEKSPKSDIWSLTPVCLSNEDDVVLWSSSPVPISGTSGQIYYSRKNCRFQEIDFAWGYSQDYFPYSENLYMPS